MKKITKILIWIVVAEVIFISLMTGGSYLFQEKYVAEVKEVELTTHAQKVWISALEWCESRGKPSAVNAKDRDGTASYYSFQFKPGTFRYYGEKYLVLEPDLDEETLFERMKDQKVQHLILEHMVKDQKNIKWGNEFPMCVKKLGKPPVY